MIALSEDRASQLEPASENWLLLQQQRLFPPPRAFIRRRQVCLRLPQPGVSEEREGIRGVAPLGSLLLRAARLLLSSRSRERERDREGERKGEGARSARSLSRSSLLVSALPCPSSPPPGPGPRPAVVVVVDVALAGGQSSIVRRKVSTKTNVVWIGKAKLRARRKVLVLLII